MEPGTAAAPARAVARSGQPAPLRGRVVVIDPGHNGDNYRHPAEIGRLVDAGGFRKACDTTGTVDATGYTEAAYTLDVARRLARLLRRRGARVILTRTRNDGWGPCIDERAAIANRARADAAISIHADGAAAAGRGFHVIYPAPARARSARVAARSRRLAVRVRDAFHAMTGAPYSTYAGRAGLQARDDLGGLNLSRVPKVLVETANMRNPSEARRLRRPAYRELQARGLARGVTSFLRVRE
ncbi:MAG: N-acetylmuramoyl-L-alanine amidase [Thermoleophilia bacterium]|nr:N-acetylmuramoyl-L-alanine amidase [Thermoleophilia bacterium]